LGGGVADALPAPMDLLLFPLLSAGEMAGEVGSMARGRQTDSQTGRQTGRQAGSD
jgi:hypothetical protein